MLSGAYVGLYPPSESVELSDPSLNGGSCPGIFVIGSDGAGERLVLDLNQPSHHVLLANVVCIDWAEALVQAPSVSSFLTEIEAGTFKFSFS